MRRIPPKRHVLAVLALSASLFPGCSCSDDGTGGGGLPAPSEARELTERTVAELVTPFDVSRQDLVGPDDHNAMYGHRPKIVARPDGASVDVLVQDEGVDTALGVIFVCQRPAEIDHQPVAQVLGDVSFVARGHVPAGFAVGLHQLAKLLRVDRLEQAC